MTITRIVLIMSFLATAQFGCAKNDSPSGGGSGSRPPAEGGSDDNASGEKAAEGATTGSDGSSKDGKSVQSSQPTQQGTAGTPQAQPTVPHVAVPRIIVPDPSKNVDPNRTDENPTKPGERLAQGTVPHPYETPSVDATQGATNPQADSNQPTPSAKVPTVTQVPNSTLGQGQAQTTPSSPPTTAAPDTSQRSTLSPPSTPLAAAFFRLVDAPTGNIDELEQRAAEVAEETYNEDDQIIPKLRELQELIYERHKVGVYNAQARERVYLLEAGLAHTAAQRELYGIGKDAAIILSSALAMAVLRGYDFQFHPVQATGSAARGVRDAVVAARDGAKSVGSGILNIFRGRSARQAGERVERSFWSRFRKLTPEEAFERNLGRIGLNPMEVNLVRENLIAVNQADIVYLRSLSYSRTNVRNFQISPARRPEGNERVPFLAFRQKVSGVLRPQYAYYQTRPVTEETLTEISSKVFYGADKRQFARVVDAPSQSRSRFTGEFGERVRTGASNARDTAQREIGNFATRIYQNFDRGQFMDTALKSSALLGAGYALGYRHNYNFPEVHLEALIEHQENK